MKIQTLTNFPQLDSSFFRNKRLVSLPFSPRKVGYYITLLLL